MDAVLKQCACCGEDISVLIHDDGKYEGGHYFGICEVPIEGTGKWVKAGKSTLFGGEVNVVDWSGEYNEVEYWECDPCYDKE